MNDELINTGITYAGTIMGVIFGKIYSSWFWALLFIATIQFIFLIKLITKEEYGR